MPSLLAGYMAFACRRERAAAPDRSCARRASAIGIPFVKRDVDTAGQTMFLLNVGERRGLHTRHERKRAHQLLLDVPDKAQRLSATPR
ncbi:MAG: hypothetical protein ACLRM9_08885 [Collinsella aerofaciens]